MQSAEKILSNHMLRYGYQSIELPEIAPAELFLTRAGDKIIDQLLIFEHKDQRFALRPEFTALAAQHYLTLQAQESVRWQFEGTVYKNSFNATHHSDYHKTSVGAEFIGATNPDADVEIIAMAAHGITELGIDDWQMVIGHVGVQRALLKALKLEPRLQEMMLSQRDSYRHGQDFLNPKGSDGLTTDSEISVNSDEDLNQTGYALDLLLNATRYGDVMGGRTRQDITERLLKKRQRLSKQPEIKRAWMLLQEWSKITSPPESAFVTMRELLTKYNINGDEQIQSLLTEWSNIIDSLEEYDIPLERIIIQPDLTRNWNYYTGIVFGIQTDHDNYVASGGRYDELIRVVSDGERHVPSVGMAFHLERMSLKIDQTTQKQLNIGGYQVKNIAHDLRQRGHAVALFDVHDERCDIYVQESSILFKNTHETVSFRNLEQAVLILEEYAR